MPTQPLGWRWCSCCFIMRLPLVIRGCLQRCRLAPPPPGPRPITQLAQLGRGRGGAR
jgi:hypothetical protein